MAPQLKLIDAPESADESACYIDTPLGVVAVLRAIAAAGTRTAAYLDGGETFLQTVLLAVAGKPPALFFDQSADTDLNRAVLATERVTFVTSDQGVPVQFSCLGARVVSHEGAEAFCVSLPNRVLRLQRRNFYRLPGEPVHARVACEIKFQVENVCHVMKPQVLDLSCGGVGAGLPAEAPLLEPNARGECTIDLPDLGQVSAAVEVRSHAEIEPPRERAVYRYGLEFVNLASKGSALIQRFITDQQRARKRVTGL